MKKILLAVIFCLLTSNMANAEGAWVLWESNSNDGYLHWQVKDAFPSYKECKQAQRFECELWKKRYLEGSKAPNTKVDSVSDIGCPDTLVVFFNDSSHPQEINCKCFPDTIDPRK